MSFTDSIAQLVAANTNGLLDAHLTWSRIPLREVFEVQNGFPFESNLFNNNGVGVPLLRIRDIVRGTTETYYSGPFDEALLVQPGDIVVGMDGDFNVGVWRGVPALLNQRVCRLVPRGGYVPRLLPLVLQGYLAAIHSRTSSITVKHLSSKTIEEIPIPLPAADEQVRLLDALESYLSRLDDAVASLERVQAKLKAYRASVLKAAVEGRLVPTEAELARREGRAYEPASVLLDRILVERRRRWEEAELARLVKAGKPPKDDKWKAKYEPPEPPDTSQLPPLPEGWCWATVDQVGDVVLGRQRAPQYLTGSHTKPYLRVANIKDDSIDLSDIEEMDFDSEHFEKYRLFHGDILVSEGQSPHLVGQSAIYRGDVDGLCFQKTLHRFRAVPGGPSPEYAQIVFRANVKLGVFRAIAAITTNIAHLTLEKFKASRFALAPAAEQTEIEFQVAKLMSIASAIDADSKMQLVRIRRLRQSILRWAFEGKLVDQDPNDEPASALLARIAAERAATPAPKRPRARRPKAAP